MIREARNIHKQLRAITRITLTIALLAFCGVVVLYIWLKWFEIGRAHV